MEEKKHHENLESRTGGPTTCVAVRRVVRCGRGTAPDGWCTDLWFLSWEKGIEKGRQGPRVLRGAKLWQREEISVNSWACRRVSAPEKHTFAGHGAPQRMGKALWLRGGTETLF